jgi:hypothetical protein
MIPAWLRLGNWAAEAVFMFGFFRKKTGSPLRASEKIVKQPPGEVFPWPQSYVLTALDEVTIALPTAVLGKNELIGSVVLGSPDIGISIPKTGDTFFIRLKPGMSVSLSKSCQARVVADDKQPRRFKISGFEQTISGFEQMEKKA